MSIESYDIDDIGYSNPNRFICTDPGCDGSNCPGDNHDKK